MATKKKAEAKLKKAPVAKKTPVKKAAKPAEALKSAPKALSKAPAKVAAPKVPQEISREERMEKPKGVSSVKTPVTQKLGNYFYANGKRKTAVSSVRLFTEGKGTVTINGRTFENYFPLALDQDKALSPLRMTNTLKMFDVTVQIHGGGVHSQAEAVRHGIAKALLLHDANLRTTLKHAGFITRDSRVKERKKYGLKRARRAPQWQKR